MAATFNNVKVKSIYIFILKVNIIQALKMCFKQEWELKLSLSTQLQPNKNMTYDNEKFLLVNNSALVVIQVLSIDF